MTDYSFCEGIMAGPHTRWHIRKLSSKGRKLGGGIDTASLCGAIGPVSDGVMRNGWDLAVEITKHHLGHSCKECARRYREETEGADG